MSVIPNLVVISPVQEKEFVMQDVLDNMDAFSQFDHGYAQNPLTVIIQDWTILHDICSTYDLLTINFCTFKGEKINIQHSMRLLNTISSLNIHN